MFDLVARFDLANETEPERRLRAHLRVDIETGVEYDLVENPPPMELIPEDEIHLFEEEDDVGSEDGEGVGNEEDSVKDEDNADVFTEDSCITVSPSLCGHYFCVFWMSPTPFRADMSGEHAK